MPYYRIVIRTKKRVKPFVGIRSYTSDRIDNVYTEIQRRCSDIYGTNLIDVEVHMLPKMCKAVQEYIKKVKK